MFDDADKNEDGLAGVLGPVYDRVIEGVDVYLAGVDDLLFQEVNITVRESAGVPGWVGVVEADLTPYMDSKLELRLPNESARRGVMFIVGGEIFGRTLIRGTGLMPGDTPRVRSRPRLSPERQELP